jgi:hypothetical protein
MYDDEDAPTIEFITVASAATSSQRRVATLQGLGAGAVGDDAGAERFDNVELAQPAGLFALPQTTSNTEAVVIRRGDEAIALVVIDKSRPPQDVEAGETRLHGVGGSNSATVIRLRANGAVEITSLTGQNVTVTAPAAGTVVLQDGSQAFVRGAQYATALTAYLAAEGTLLTATSVFLGLLSTYVTAIQPIADPTNAQTPILTAGIGALQAAIAARAASVSTFASTAVSAPAGWLSTKVRGQ